MRIAALAASKTALAFVEDANKYGKAIPAVGDGADVLAVAGVDPQSEGVVIGKNAAAVAPAFMESIGNHRAWSREAREAVPA